MLVTYTAYRYSNIFDDRSLINRSEFYLIQKKSDILLFLVFNDIFK
jgi:hypothetical protein